MEISSPLVRFKFVRRYKRFLVDMEAPDGTVVVAHCPNTGSLKGVMERCTYVHVKDYGEEGGRKLRYGVEEMELEDGMRVLVNTQRSNGLVLAALRAGLVEGIGKDWPVKVEAKFDAGTRFDLCATAPDGGLVWGEIKLATYAVGDVSMFPDAVTERGEKHLRVLTEVVRGGGRAVQIYVVGRGDTQALQAAVHIDPAYAAALRAAKDAGVTVVALRWEAGRDALGPLLRVAT